MKPITYNKPASRQGSILTEQVIAPARGAACTDMNWHKLLNYDPGTGTLTWKPRPKTYKDWKRWNGRYAGKRVGYDRSKAGQRGIHFPCMGKHYSAHRVIMEMCGVEIPKGCYVDHIDGNPRNNRINNLRVATPQQNSFNAKTSCANKLGLKGVSCTGYMYEARITKGYETITIGTYRTKGEAAVARAKAALRLHGKYFRVS